MWLRYGNQDEVSTLPDSRRAWFGGGRGRAKFNLVVDYHMDVTSRELGICNGNKRALRYGVEGFGTTCIQVKRV